MAAESANAVSGPDDFMHRALSELRERVFLDEAMIRNVEQRKKRRRPSRYGTGDDALPDPSADYPLATHVGAVETFDLHPARTITPIATAQHVTPPAEEILRERIRFSIKRRLAKGTHISARRVSAHGIVLLPCLHTEYVALFPNKRNSFDLAGDEAVQYFNEQLGPNWNRYTDSSGTAHVVSTGIARAQAASSATGAPTPTVVHVRWIQRRLKDYSSSAHGTALGCGFLKISFYIVRGAA